MEGGSNQSSMVVGVAVVVVVVVFVIVEVGVVAVEAVVVADEAVVAVVECFDQWYIVVEQHCFVVAVETGEVVD